MKYLASIGFMAAISLNCHAKSTEDCEREFGDQDRDVIAKCLLTSSRSANQAAPQKKPEKEPPSIVQKISIARVNSAGGVDVKAVIRNLNPNSAIKYAYIEVILFNAVGDQIRSEVGGDTSKNLQITGPIPNSSKPKSYYWSALWYNATAHCLQVKSVDIQYMDGTRSIFDGKGLGKALDKRIGNSCAVK